MAGPFGSSRSGSSEPVCNGRQLANVPISSSVSRCCSSHVQSLEQEPTPALLPAHAAHPPHAHRYDSHRDQILRSGERHQAGGGAEFTPGQRPDDEPDLYQFFTASCFSGFGDGPRVSGRVEQGPSIQQVWMMRMMLGLQQGCIRCQVADTNKGGQRLQQQQHAAAAKRSHPQHTCL